MNIRHVPVGFQPASIQLNKEACCSSKEPAITPNRTEALDNAQYMQNNEVDYYFVTWLFHLKCYACFLFVKSVDILGTKTHMKISFMDMR